MLLVDDLAAGGTKNLRHTPRGLVTLSLMWSADDNIRVQGQIQNFWKGGSCTDPHFQRKMFQERNCN